MRSSMLRALAVVILVSGPAVAGDPSESERFNWRGPNRDGHSPDTGLLKSWPDGGPKLSWKTTGLGEGLASVSIEGDRIYTMGQSGEGSRLIALNRASGKIEWTAAVGRVFEHGRDPGPRSTPATDGDLVYALGRFGNLVCVDAKDGTIRWKKNLGRDFGGKQMSGWGYTESPLIDGDNLVCTPGGSRGTVLALKKDTGAIVWQSRGLTDEAGYCSLVPVEIGGKRQYLVFTGQSVAGVDTGEGKVLWKVARKGRTAICSAPVYKDGYLFASSAYGIGFNGFRITEAGGRFQAKEIYAGKQLDSHHGGVVRVGDHVYGLGGRGLVCVELKTGKVAWQNRSVGKGSIAFADGHLIVRNENYKRGANGLIALVEATPEGYNEKGRFKQPDLSGKPAWPHPVVFGGKLYIRDHDVLLCYDVKGN